MSTNFYIILQVSESATQRDIKVAYRKLVQTYHPDINSSEADGEQIKLINLAYETLSNPEKRARYDRSLHGGFHDNESASYTPPPPPRRPPPYYYQRKAHTSSAPTYSLKTQILGWGATITILLCVVAGVYAMQYFTSEYYFTQGLEAEGRNEFEKAISLYQLAIRDWGAKSVDASIKSAQLSRNIGAFYYMADFCKKGLLHGPDSTQTALLFYLEGTAYVRIEQFERAESAFYNSLIYKFQKDSIYQALATLYVNNLGEYEKAEKMYSYLLSGNSINLANYYNRGICYQNMGKFDLAILDFQRVLEDNPFHGKTLFQLGRSYLAIGNKELACEYLRFSERQGVYLDPKDLAEACKQY
mgnify:CR=1 FL=1